MGFLMAYNRYVYSLDFPTWDIEVITFIMIVNAQQNVACSFSILFRLPQISKDSAKQGMMCSLFDTELMRPKFDQRFAIFLLENSQTWPAYVH